MSQELTPWLTEEEQVAWRAYLRGSARLSALIGHDLYQSHGLTLNKYEVLVRLSEAEDWTMRMSDLAENLVHSRSRLTRTVASLEEDGFVIREACTGDRRGRNCRLTQEGYDYLDKIAPDHVESVRRRVIDRIGIDNLLELGRILSALADDSVADLKGLD